MVVEVSSSAKVYGGRYLAFKVDGYAIEDVHFTAHPEDWEEISS